MKKILLVILLFGLTICGCEKDFSVSQQTSAKKMVINSLFNNGGPVVVYLTDSYLASTQGNINSINDARMELYEDNVLKEVMKYTPSDSVNTFGAYKSILFPKAGKNYSIKVTEPVYGVSTASDAVPLPASITTQQLVQYGDSATHSNDVIVDLGIKDDGSTENYYRINVWIGGQQWFLNGTDTVTQPYFEARGPQMLTTVVDTVRDGLFLLFSDKNFNGQTKDLKMKFDKLDPHSFTSLSIFVDFYTASKSDYEYQQTLSTYRSTSSSANSEPVHVFSNVQNGYGIFAAEQYQGVVFNIK
ncbi:MAG: hypothetical protein JWO06_3351 [Bacteroidota bacterium]|nr:hypothetical protein [Bacteroidota bacterium]